jgi:PAS domain S-box-containing protein
MVQSGIKPHVELHDLLPFERLLAEISTFFINLPADQIDNEIKAAQRRMCEFLDLDRSSLGQVSEREPMVLPLTHVHQPEGSALPEGLNGIEFFPWTAQKVLAGQTVTINKMSDLPPEAERDRKSFGLYGTKSAVVVPLSIGGRPPIGVLTFSVLREQRDWPETVVQQFQLVAQIFANALSRKQTEKSLEERLQFEMLLADISARFINLPSDSVDGAIEDAQRRVCECLGLDLCALWQWSADAPGLLTMTHIYRSQEGPPLPEPMDAQEYFPWCQQQLEAGKIIAVSSMVELSAEAARDVENFRYFGIKSCLTFPLSLGDGPPIGALGFNTMQAERTWPETIVKRLQLVTQIFTHALARGRAERKLVESEQRLRLITNALPVLIAYVDADLRYRFNNDAYRVWFGVSPEEALGRTIREVVGEGFFQSVRPYVERALSGEHVRCALDVEMAGRRPMAVEAIYVPDVDEQADVRGLYVLVIDVTDRNLAQQESRRLQDELLHAGRISTMGELAGALAHEINQPLSAIMSNAQAARRYLAAATPDLEEMKEILNDIVKDDARAADVIHHLRALLKKTKTALEPLDLNFIFREVWGLLRSDAVIRDVKISSELDPMLPLVRGDRIQLQQVALNLILNAFEAMNEQPNGDRQVLIRTGLKDSRVLAAVTDNGNGIPIEDAEKIFKPFYTSKPQGLGMGLSICRSIINRHHGRLWAENNPDRGATFYFSLPVSAEDQSVRRE